DRQKTLWSVTVRLSLLLAAHGFDHLFGGDRYLVDPHAERIVYRGAQGGRHRQQGALARLLGPVWAFGVDRLDDERLDLRHVEKSRRLVLEHRRPLVQAFAKRLLLHERFAEAHVHAAFDLAFHEQWVDRTSDVVRDPDLVDANQAGARVGVDVDDARRVAVGGAWSDARAFVRSGDLGRRVAARGREGAEPRLGQHACLFEGDVIDPAAACFHRFDQE